MRSDLAFRSLVLAILGKRRTKENAFCPSPPARPDSLCEHDQRLGLIDVDDEAHVGIIEAFGESAGSDNEPLFGP